MKQIKLKRDFSLNSEINVNDTIIVSERLYRQERYLDLRVYYPDENGELRPSKKGFTVPYSQKQELMTAIKKI